MSRARRTHFATPFVISVAAAGCGQGKATDPTPTPGRPTWYVQRQGDDCSAHQQIKCPPPDVATCNPPAPMYLPCPPQAAESFQVVQLEGGRCVIEGSQTAVTCPSYDRPPPPIDAAAAPVTVVRRWELDRAPDGTCTASNDPCVRMQRKPDDPIPPCNPPAPVKLACPAAELVAIVEVVAGQCHGATAADCMGDPRAQCSSAPVRPTACPE